MEYLTKEEVAALNDSDLDSYARTMSVHQIEILAVIELWTNAYNIAKDEYISRKGKSNKFTIMNDSTTKH